VTSLLLSPELIRRHLTNGQPEVRVIAPGRRLLPWSEPCSRDLQTRSTPRSTPVRK
jgi:hypothetical protein